MAKQAERKQAGPQGSENFIEQTYKKIARYNRKNKDCCRGIEDKPHDYRPYDKYPWVEDGIAKYPVSMPWELHFARCAKCHQCKVWTTPVDNYDPKPREERWLEIKTLEAEQWKNLPLNTVDLAGREHLYVGYKF